MSRLNRRDFLKLAALAAPALAIRKLGLPGLAPVRLQDENPPNVIVLVFDAMSSRNLSVYGYVRETTPNLARFAERATVYHQHNSSGNFTVPGTASLLTGCYPWTHRAFNHNGLVARGLSDRNVFGAFAPGYQRAAFTQNVWANSILTQFQGDIDRLLSPGAFGLFNYLIADEFRDSGGAYRAFDDFLFQVPAPPASLIFGSIEKSLFFRDVARLRDDDYPRGVPHIIDYPSYYRVDQLFAGMASLIESLAAPFMAYLHVLPPHAPYRPSRTYDKPFTGRWHPIQKPQHRLAAGVTAPAMNNARLTYDQYVATADAEFGKFLDRLESQGILDNTYLVVTSDHGEMFERGERGHDTPLLYDPIVHIPLLIAAPGQSQRQDVHAFTNAVDVLPTLLQLIGRSVPAWCEGSLLPGLGGAEDFDRSTFSVEAKLNSAFGALKEASVVIRKSGFKMILYEGYAAEDGFELYNLLDDPEELIDLYPGKPAVSALLKAELLDRLHDANRPFER